MIDDRGDKGDAITLLDRLEGESILALLTLFHLGLFLFVKLTLIPPSHIMVVTLAPDLHYGL